MAWTTPKTWAAGAITAAEMNQEVRDNLNALRAERVVGGYAVGDWTPIFAVDGIGLPGSSGTGRYFKIGALICATFTLIGNRGSASAGNLYVSGLPFAAATTQSYWGASIDYTADFLSLIGYSVGGYLEDGSQDIALMSLTSTVATAMTYANLPVSPDCRIIGSILYEA